MTLVSLFPFLSNKAALPVIVRGVGTFLRTKRIYRKFISLCLVWIGRGLLLERIIAQPGCLMCSNDIRQLACCNARLLNNPRPVSWNILTRDRGAVHIWTFEYALTLGLPAIDLGGGFPPICSSISSKISQEPCQQPCICSFCMSRDSRWSVALSQILDLGITIVLAYVLTVGISGSECPHTVEALPKSFNAGSWLNMYNAVWAGMVPDENPVSHCPAPDSPICTVISVIPWRCECRPVRSSVSVSLPLCLCVIASAVDESFLTRDF